MSKKTTYNQEKGLKRNLLDKYYTKDEIVLELIKIIKEKLKISRSKDLIIEPSAGNGSFIDSLKKLCKNTLFYDTFPEHDDIITKDYLEGDYKYLKKDYRKIHIVGNPPFGRQASMAVKFIKKSCEYCDTISFILPKSFKKDSLKKAFSSYFHLIHECDIPQNAFLVNDVEYTVPCIFQIWEKKDKKRSIKVKQDPKNFTFVKKNEDPDISFRRVGVYAGKIDVEIVSKSIQSHYFIKFTNDKSLEENLKLLKDITFDFNNTVGPKSISKGELIEKFNPLL